MARTMKDSGVEWIGEIPENWETVRTKNTATLFNGNSIKDDEKSQYEDSTDAIPYISTKDIDNLHNIDYSNGMYVKNDDPNFKVAHKNSTLMCIEGGSAGIKKAKLKQDVCFVNKLCCFEPKSIDSDYLYYFLNNPKYEDHFKSLMSGLIGGVSISDLKNINCTLPPISEQQKIAEFLDDKCGAIDEIISKTEQSIEEYKKLKQSVITKAVTKGIRQNRPMQDSNIEWIGEIPTDWEIRKIFQIFTQVKNKNQGMIENNLLSLSYGKIKQKNIETSFGLLPESFETYNIIEKDDIVLRLTDLQNDHRSLRVGLCKERGIITSAYVTMRLKDKQYAPYLYYLLHTFDIKKGFYGMGDGVRQGLNWDELKHLSLVLPPLNEQKEIADYLDEKCAKIDTLIEKKQQFISEMANYKKSLIYEYVTGKKEVA